MVRELRVRALVLVTVTAQHRRREVTTTTPAFRVRASRSFALLRALCSSRATMESARHTLLLVQFNSNLASRTFLDYESLALAMDGVCALYEKELKVLNPKVVNITYDISDLYSYLDQLADISLLVYVRTHLAVIPQLVCEEELAALV